MPVISTDTTAGITLAANESLTVLAKGSIINPSANISGTAATGQSVTILGVVDVYYIWFGGDNRLTIGVGGTFIGHSPSPIYLGLGPVTVGGNEIVNAGLIQCDKGAIQVFGADNVIQNSGSIFAGDLAIFTAGNGMNSVQNSGSIASTRSIGITLNGSHDWITNTGSIAGRTGGVLMKNSQQMLDNSGQIFSAINVGVIVENTGSQIHNSGTISVGSGKALWFLTAAAALNSVINEGRISGQTGVAFDGGDVKIVNSGWIVATNGPAIGGASLTVDGITTILNSGTISSPTNAIQTGAERDILINTGTIEGAVTLGGGNDRFDGRGGRVTGDVTGDAGSDTYIIDDASLALFEGAGVVGDVDLVKSTVSYQLEVNFETLQLLGGADIKGTGNAQANVIIGNAGDNRLSGLDGTDTVIGGAGDDTLRGGLGVDSLAGGEGDDVLRGGSAGDTMTGNDGDDTLIGGAGGGRDAMYGSTGADRFLFETLGDTGKTQALADVIGDFAQGFDLIDLSRLDAKTGTAANDSFTFIGAAAFSGVAGQLHAVQVAGNTYVEYDATGDAEVDGIIRLTGLLTLTAADFVL